MHILVTNDDGPPSAESSPYILPFVRHLEAGGHLVSVAIPHTQRSWIAKAHMVGADVVSRPYIPEPYHPPPAPPSSSSSPSSSSPSSASTTTTTTTKPPYPPSGTPTRPWHLITSTPASCAQIGLHHLFTTTTAAAAPVLPPIDLVISGPNYGRNTTACFALSSGTLGAALEAALANVPSIALSFAFTDRTNRPEDVAAACRHAVTLVQYLCSRPGAWDAPDPASAAAGHDDVILAAAPTDDEHDPAAAAPAAAKANPNPAGLVYSVNVPVRSDVESRPTRWTRVLQNSWRTSCFSEHEPEPAPVVVVERAAAAAAEHEIRAGETAAAAAAAGAAGDGRQELETSGGGARGGDVGPAAAAAAAAAAAGGERHFKWAPSFKDVYDSVRRTGEGSDGWAVSEGETSVTVLRANFLHAGPGRGLIRL